MSCPKLQGRFRGVCPGPESLSETLTHGVYEGLIWMRVKQELKTIYSDWSDSFEQIKMVMNGRVVVVFLISSSGTLGTGSAVSEA